MRACEIAWLRDYDSLSETCAQICLLTRISVASTKSFSRLCHSTDNEQHDRIDTEMKSAAASSRHANIAFVSFFTVRAHAQIFSTESIRLTFNRVATANVETKKKLKNMHTSNARQRT